MANARGVDRGFFPLDKELKLLPGSLTPYGHEILVRLSAWMPFKKAVELLADLVGIRVSQSQGRRYAEGAGAAYVEIQNQAVEQIEKGLPAVQQGKRKDANQCGWRHGTAAAWAVGRSQDAGGWGSSTGGQGKGGMGGTYAGVVLFFTQGECPGI